MARKLLHFFASDQSFLDPAISNDGSPYGPKRYKELIRECWYISDALHTSYTDVLDISVTQRRQLIRCIKQKIQVQGRAMQQARAKTQSKKR